MTLQVDEGKAVNVVYLGFSKAFDTVFHSIPLETPASHDQVCCSLDGQSQRVVVSRVKSN